MESLLPPYRSIRRLAVVLLVALVGSSVASAAPVLRAAAAEGLVTTHVIGSPFSPNGDGLNDRSFVDVTLAEPATVTITVRDFGEARVRTLADGVSRAAGTFRWRWNGRSSSGTLVPDGPYSFRVTAVAASGQATVERGVAKSPEAFYPAAPGSIVVALNPGHGDPDDGAFYGGYREADLNLAIAQRLRAMLEASGVAVVMIRTSDTHANEPPVDRDGDGRVDVDDEFLARNDLANEARPDLYVTLMNNAYGYTYVHGTETFTSEQRTWTPEGVALARAIQTAHMRRLATLRTPSWQPIDRGVKFHPFTMLEPYSSRMRRPALMTSVLVESLFMSNRAELRMLVKPSTLTTLTAAYFDGIARWLDHRDYGLRYDLANVPTSAPSGGTTALDMRLTNRGNRSSKGWVLQARIVPAVPYYDGSPNRGTLVAETRLPDGLAPGASLDVSMPAIPMPATNGEWLVKLDVRLPGGGTLGDHGVVGPQVRVTTDGAAPAVGAGASGTTADSWSVALPDDPLRDVPGPGGTRQPTGLESWWTCVVRQPDIPAGSSDAVWGVDHYDR